MKQESNKMQKCIFSLKNFFSVQGVDRRLSCILGNCSTTELHFQPTMCYFHKSYFSFLKLYFFMVLKPLKIGCNFVKKKCVFPYLDQPTEIRNLIGSK